MIVVYILFINPSIVMWRQLFRNYRKGFVFLFTGVFQFLLLSGVPLHRLYKDWGPQWETEYFFIIAALLEITLIFWQ